MKTLIIYDSIFGNTEQIAQAIADALKPQNEVLLMRVGGVKPEHMQGLELLIVGSPTRKFAATPEIFSFIKSISIQDLKGVRVAAFDTRISLNDIRPALLRFMVKLGGYAAEPIVKRLKKKGGEQAIPPEGFLVNGTEGPLKDGELERAEKWAIQIIEKNRP
jgi:flavodoxin I